MSIQLLNKTITLHLKTTLGLLSGLSVLWKEGRYDETGYVACVRDETFVQNRSL
jgi:hypothetical protein